MATPITDKYNSIFRIVGYSAGNKGTAYDRLYAVQNCHIKIAEIKHLPDDAWEALFDVVREDDSLPVVFRRVAQERRTFRQLTHVFVIFPNGNYFQLIKRDDNIPFNFNRLWTKNGIFRPEDDIPEDVKRLAYLA